MTVGDELLIGQVVDSNSAWLGAQLESVNIKVTEIRSIQDTEDEIIGNLDSMLAKSDAVLITGGLGPTKDDVTKKSLAKYMGVELVWKEEIFEWIKQLFSKFKIDLKESHRSQAYVPDGTHVILNRMGTAQGMWLEKDGKIIISMPGVPYEMKYIMENGGLEKLALRNEGGSIRHKTIMTAGWGETMIEEKISPIIEELPEHMKIAYLPSLGSVRVRLSSTGGSEEEVDEYTQKITASLGSIVYAYDDQSLASAIGEMLVARKLQVGTAESCTGGLVAKMITSIPGSSRYYKGSVVAYANDLKQDLLNVSAENLKNHGAVSEQTVSEMVGGVIDSLGVDLGIATSGIAGPGGGTPQKPVGTIWIAVGSKDKVKTRKLQLTKNRLKNIEYTSFAALNLLRKFLLGH